MRGNASLENLREGTGEARHNGLTLERLIRVEDLPRAVVAIERGRRGRHDLDH